MLSPTFLALHLDDVVGGRFHADTADQDVAHSRVGILDGNVQI